MSTILTLAVNKYEIVGGLGVVCDVGGGILIMIMERSFKSRRCMLPYVQGSNIII